MEKTENKNLKQFLEKEYGKDLSDLEVRQSKDRLVSFFELLIQIDKRQKKSNEKSN